MFFLRRNAILYFIPFIFSLMSCGDESDNGIKPHKQLAPESSSHTNFYSSSSNKSNTTNLSSAENNQIKLSSAIDYASENECKPYDDNILSSDSQFDWSVSKENYLNKEIEYNSFVDERDNQVYKIVKIGNQIWMAQNLNYSDSITSPSLRNEGMLCYDKKEEDCMVGGRLYNWGAAIDCYQIFLTSKVDCCNNSRICTMDFARVQGVCPVGWHLPTEDDWDTLIDYLGGEKTAQVILKSQIGWNVNNGVDGNGSDVVGFSALPSGLYFPGIGFIGAGDRTGFWRYVEYSGHMVGTIFLNGLNSLSIRSTSKKENYHAIRCIHD